MILGLGNDMTDIRRIEAALERFGARFEERVFTPGERKRAAGRAESYAKRFAAKEACVKALATRQLSWQDMEVGNHENGAAFLTFSGAALTRLKALTPHGHIPKIHVSMTDEYPLAHAVVILEALPL